MEGDADLTSCCPLNFCDNECHESCHELAKIFGRNTLHHKIALRIAELKCDVGKKNAFLGWDHRHEEKLDRIVKDEGDESGDEGFFFSGDGFKLSSQVHFHKESPDSWVHVYTASRFELEHVRQHG